MSLLPGRILPQNQALGRVNEDGTVTIDKNWWLLIYNLCLQTLGTGGGLPADALIDIESLDMDAADSDAIVLRQPISNLSVQSADLASTVQDFPAIATALLLAQDPALQLPQPAAQPVASITVTASPFTYTVPANGTVVVNGGIVSAIAISRQGTSVTTGLIDAVLPVSRLDQVTVTYTGLPTMTFLPT